MFLDNELLLQCLLKMFAIWPEHKLEIICAPHWSVNPVSQSLTEVHVHEELARVIM